MSERGDHYTIQQTAEALRIPVQNVVELIDEGELQAYYDEEKGYRLVDASSIRSYLLKKPPPEQSPFVNATPDRPPRSQERNRTADTVVLIIIALITLSAAVYTLVTALLSGG